MKVIYKKILENFLKTYAKYENKSFRLFTVIGFLLLLKTVPKILNKLFPIFRRKLDIREYGENSWAVVTGATDGIGKGFCEILASRGFNLYLVSRNYQKLTELKKEFAEKYKNILTHIICQDFTGSSEPNFFETLSREIELHDISILVNNVGLGYYELFNEVKLSQLKQVLTVNCFPVVQLSAICLEKMKVRPYKSAIINLSSAASATPYPYLSLYSATKAFDDLFSRSLALEVPSKIRVVSLRPMYVTTAMTFYKKGIDTISPKECAEACLDRLNLYDQTFGHWKHTLIGNFIDMIPEPIRILILKLLGRYFVRGEREKSRRKNSAA